MKRRYTQRGSRNDHDVLSANAFGDARFTAFEPMIGLLARRAQEIAIGA